MSGKAEQIVALKEQVAQLNERIQQNADQVTTLNAQVTSFQTKYNHAKLQLDAWSPQTLFQEYTKLSVKIGEDVKGK